jgi:hypothetical protein
LVSSYGTDAHAADSADHGQETLLDAGFSPDELEIIHDLAEHVSGNYTYTGEAIEIARRIRDGKK